MTIEYKTKDLAESSALVTCGCRLIRIERTGSVAWFVFNDEVNCQKLSNEFFFGNLTGSLKVYSEAIRMLKNRLFSV